jgi:hypothetical protein
MLSDLDDTTGAPTVTVPAQPTRALLTVTTPSRSQTRAYVAIGALLAVIAAVGALIAIGQHPGSRRPPSTPAASTTVPPALAHAINQLDQAVRR